MADITTGSTNRGGTVALLRKELHDGLERLTWIARESLEAGVGLLTLTGDGEPHHLSLRSGDNDNGRADLVSNGATARVLEFNGPLGLFREGEDRTNGSIPAPYRSYLGTPIEAHDGGKPYGVLAVLDERLRSWDDRERKILSRLADAVATELSVNRLSLELEDAHGRLVRVRADLEKERVQLREMIRMAPSFIASVEGPDAVFTMANDPFYRLVGRRDLIGRPLREALPELEGQGVHELVEQVFRLGQSLGADEARIRLRRGENGPMEDRFVSFVYQPLIGPEWEVKGVLVSGVDVTEQVQARNAAESAATDFRLMAETIHQVFWVADATGGEVLYVSPAATEVWGVDREEMLRPGRWMMSVTEEDRPRVEATYTPQKLHEGSYDIEYRIERGDGSIRWVRDRAYPIRDEHGTIYRIVGIAEDVTERRALELQLRQSQKMEAIGRLAGGIAHDFNNMLTAISGHAQLMEAEIPPTSHLQDHIGVIRMATDRSAALTRQLLAFSRKQILQPRNVNLNQVVRAIEPMLRRMIGEDVDMHTALPQDLPPIFADPSQVEQVLMNLIVNARDAMPGGGKLTISTAAAELTEEYFRAHQVDMPAGDYAVLHVSDSGIGMDRLTQARIFEPFFTTKPAGKGTGLGLSTVYGIVKQTGGFVWVYSEPGVGTTFKVYLPMAEHHGAVETTGAPASLAPVRGATILVVEDDESVRTLVTRVLDRAGYRVVEAGDARAAAAISSAHQGPIELLLTDVVLPGLSGNMVADLVASDHPEARVLYMSGYTDEAIVRHGVLEPGTEFLEKPFAPEDLLRKVAMILQQRPAS